MCWSRWIYASIAVCARAISSLIKESTVCAALSRMLPLRSEMMPLKAFSMTLSIVVFVRSMASAISPWIRCFVPSISWTISLAWWEFSIGRAFENGTIPLADIVVFCVRPTSILFELAFSNSNVLCSVVSTMSFGCRCPIQLYVVQFQF